MIKRATWMLLFVLLSFTHLAFAGRARAATMVVIVEGDAARVTDDALLDRLAAAWRAKWDGQWQFAAHDGAFHHGDGGRALVFRVAPTKVLAFGKGTFTHTRHRF